MLPSGIYSNGWLLDGALLGPGSIPCCQIKLVVVGWITTQGLEMTEEKLPLLFHLAMVKLFQSSWVINDENPKAPSQSSFHFRS